MKAKHTSLLTTAALTAGLTSCVFDAEPVPEMPYRPRPVIVTAPRQQEEQPPEQTTTWETASAPGNHITEALAEKMPAAEEPKPAPALPEPLPAPSTPAPEPEPVKPQTAIIPLEITPYTTSTKTAAAAAATATTVTDLKSITNDGPIPTAMQVDGDPTRVWNPLDPSKKIRIIDPKTNQRYASGKKLKVRNTNYYFYVP